MAIKRVYPNTEEECISLGIPYRPDPSFLEITGKHNGAATARFKALRMTQEAFYEALEGVGKPDPSRKHSTDPDECRELGIPDTPSDRRLAEASIGNGPARARYIALIRTQEDYYDGLPTL